MNTLLYFLGTFFSLVFIFSFINKRSAKNILILSRSFVGIVFIYSGFVKAIDPLGSTYKFIDYFNAFGLESLNNYAFYLAILLSSLEFLIGVMLLINLQAKIASIFALAFMSVFTPLTLVLAINNPVSDCGCFGDALILTNWQTFFKNIVILIPTVLLIINLNNIKTFLNKYIEILIIAGFAFLITLFSVYNYENLPVIDFRPFKIGNNISALKKEYYELSDTIPEEKKIIESTPEDRREYVAESTYIYEKNGEAKEFTEIPDSTWTWKETITNVISEGYKPPIHDFSIYNDTEGDITEMVLNDTGYVYLLVSYKIDKSNFEGFKKATELALDCRDKGVKFYCLTASIDENIALLKDSLSFIFNFSQTNSSDLNTETIYYYEKDGEVKEFYEDEQPEGDDWNLVGEDQIEIEQNNTNENAFPFKFYSTDETTLKTVIRANPGIVLLKKGTIINKWHYNNFPKYCDDIK